MTYFKALRRKFGVVTLLMACMLAAVWVRSHVVCDTISWWGTNTDDCLSTTTSSVVWQRTRMTPRIEPQKNVVKETVATEVEVNGKIVVVENEILRNVTVTEHVIYKHWETHPPSGDSAYDDEPGLRWRWRCYGFGLGEFDQVSSEQQLFIKLLYIPFWSFVLPLTLISGYLLLSNPRVEETSGPIRV